MEGEQLFEISRRVLNSNRNEMGSQCRDARMGVMGWCFRTLIRIVAALFWVYWSFR